MPFPSYCLVHLDWRAILSRYQHRRDLRYIQHRPYPFEQERLFLVLEWHLHYRCPVRRSYQPMHHVDGSVNRGHACLVNRGRSLRHQKRTFLWSIRCSFTPEDHYRHQLQLEAVDIPVLHWVWILLDSSQWSNRNEILSLAPWLLARLLFTGIWK